MMTARWVVVRRLVLGFLVLVVAGIATGLIVGWIGSTVLGSVHDMKSPPPPAARASTGPGPTSAPASTATSSSSPTGAATPTGPTTSLGPTGALVIGSISPSTAAAGQRVDLRGAYPGAAPGTTIQIQQQAGSGPWKDFPAVTTVSRDGTWSMWIKTWLKGTQQLRVRDPATGATSAPVTLTIG